MNFEVVVVGASSAGLFAAELLANSGKSVVVFDRSNGIEPQKRTYIITPGLYQVMEDIPRGLIDQEIDTFRIQSGEKRAVIELASPDLIIDRAALIKLLVSRAAAAGATIIDGCEFQGFESEKGKTRIRMKKDDASFLVTADYLIGADGVHSTVRESLGIEPVPSVPLLQAVIDLPEGWDSRTTQVWFTTEDTPYFYWLIPINHNQAVVGLISEPDDNIKALLDGFLSRHDFQPISYQSGQAALHSSKAPKDFSMDGLPVILVGDAAGQVKVTTVGGTVTGFIGAHDAAERILGGNNRPFRSTVEPELDLHLLIRRLLDQMGPVDYEDLISLLNQSVTEFLSHHDRDNMRSHFWKLVFLQPRFIPLGLKLLSRSIFNGKH